MSLLYNPLECPLQKLGVDDVAADPLLPASMRVTANASIYFACLYALMHGRRDLLPSVAVWARAVTAHALSAWTPERSQNDIDLPSIRQEFPSYLLRVVEELGVGRESLRVCAKDPTPVDWVGCIQTNDPAGSGMVSLLTSFSIAGCATASCGSARTKRKPKAIRHAQELVVRLFGTDLCDFPVRAAKVLSEVPSGASMSYVWKVLSEEFCVLRLKVNLADPPEGRTPKETALARAVGGKIDPRFIELREAIHAVSFVTCVDNAVKFAEELPSNAAMATGEILSLTDMFSQYMKVYGNGFRVMTFMRKEGYAKFLRDGEVRTFWDMVKDGGNDSWHFKHSDVPEHGRAVTDNRIYGERGSDVTYAVLLHPEHTNVAEALAQMYGSVCVTWKPSAVEDCCTLSLNDSCLSPFVTPMTTENKWKYLAPFIMAKLAMYAPCDDSPIGLIAGMCVGQRVWPNFVEVQIHRRMRTEDIESVREIG